MGSLMNVTDMRIIGYVMSLSFQIAGAIMLIMKYLMEKMALI